MSVADLTTPAAAIAALCERLSPVETETVGWDESLGRVLSEPLRADRDSPPCDVSAMDGYAVRLADLAMERLPIAGEARIGRPAPELVTGSAVKIVTGAPVPKGADAVIRREDTREFHDHIELQAARVEPGQNIRRQGENLPAGEEVMAAGSLITPATISALATFGIASPLVYRKLRIGIITTGDELLPVASSPEPWRIRDCNGPFLKTLCSNCSRTEIRSSVHVPDDATLLERSLRSALETCDAVILTGGVSMGDYDHVPDVVNRVGATTVFHRLPVRPGHPILGAVSSRGQLILGLPGNPLAVMTGMCRFGRLALARLAGLTPTPCPAVRLANPDAKPLKLWWYRPVTIDSAGEAHLVSSRGSGDVPSAARSDGFVELPPEATGAGPWPLYRWEI